MLRQVAEQPLGNLERRNQSAILELIFCKDLIQGLKKRRFVGFASAGTGYAAGSLVSDKKDKKKKAGYGAAAGAFTSYLASGNIYKTALGGILGGFGGYAS